MYQYNTYDDVDDNHQHQQQQIPNPPPGMVVPIDSDTITFPSSISSSPTLNNDDDSSSPFSTPPNHQNRNNSHKLSSVFVTTPNHQPNADGMYSPRNSVDPNSIELDECQPRYNDTPNLGNLSVEDPEGRTLYSIKEIGWQGKKTAKLIAERYFFGIIVAIAVSLSIYILSLCNWTIGQTPETYYNIKTFSIFMQFALFSFGTLYITISLTVAYGIDRMKRSKVLYYCIVLSGAIIVFYGIMYAYKIHYWYYYIDAVLIIAVYAVGEVFFSYKMSMCMQKEQHPPGRDKAKARMVAINYTAPDIVVTLFTVTYMFFLIPVYFSIESNLLRLAWRLILHPIYWNIVIVVARLFLVRDISTDDIMLNSNIVLHTFFHHQTLGRIFIFSMTGDAILFTLVSMGVSALEDVLIRSIALKRDEWVCRLLHGPERAKQEVYSQQNLQLRSAIINIQCALEFSGQISAPIFIYLFYPHRQLFHFFDGGEIDPTTLFYLAVVGIVLDIISEFVCTYIEVEKYKLPHRPAWRWMKDNVWFYGWLVYGSITMGLGAMLWSCARVPRAGLCTADDICTCGSIIATGIPNWCANFTAAATTPSNIHSMIMM